MRLEKNLNRLERKMVLSAFDSEDLFLRRYLSQIDSIRAKERVFQGDSCVTFFALKGAVEADPFRDSESFVVTDVKIQFYGVPDLSSSEITVIDGVVWGAQVFFSRELRAVPRVERVFWSEGTRTDGRPPSVTDDPARRALESAVEYIPSYF